MRTQLAKLLITLGGQLSRIRTPQRIYQVEWDQESDNYDFTYQGRRWMPCSWGTKLLVSAWHIDPEHFDHWGLEHDTCSDGKCEDCGGDLCSKDKD